MILACASSPCARTTSPSTKNLPRRPPMNAQMLPLTANPPSLTATTATVATALSVDELRQRLRRLNLYGLLEHAEEVLNEPWLGRLLQIEESERLRRSLKRRLANARLATFKPMADF